MRIAHNKVNVDREIKKRIRLLFFRQVEMKYIVKEINLTERVIRRVINENDWKNKRERYLKFLCFLAFVKKISLDKMAEQAKVNRCSLGRVHRKYGLKSPSFSVWNKRVTDEMELKFIEDYKSGLSGKKIAKKYGFAMDKTVLDVLSKHNVKKRPAGIETFYDKMFFDRINSHEKAYVLGLIMTDGYILKDYSGFGIQLTKTDGYILEKISRIIGSKKGVNIICCDSKREKMPNAKDMVRLTVHNRKIAEDLKKMGVVKRKSKVLRYNGCVPKEYLSSFFRGLLDGDGCICINKHNGIQITIASASKKFIEDLKEHLIDFNSSIQKTTIYNLYILGGKEKALNFLKWVYTNKKDLYLRRKYEIMQNYVG